MSEGWVYLITNESMPGYVKIGLTRHNDVATRLRQLDTTAVPMPFECHFAARVPDCAKLESTLHFVFGSQRTRRNREYFQIDPDLAKAIISLVALESNETQQFSADVDASQKKDVEEARRRRENATFPSLGVPVGAELTFSKDPTVTCIVYSPKKVSFKSEILSVSGAALLALRDVGYAWKTVNGWSYWLYQDQSLSERWLSSRAVGELNAID